ncbi:hypothetical protein F4803DRAFT_243743 [Xylaria telfairii]|nr:hypothetical protein F4803DRAFT_243743 [Xylaria telfairii]
MDVNKTMTQSNEAHGGCAEGVEAETYDTMDSEVTVAQTDTKLRPKDGLIDKEVGETKPIGAETVESKVPEPKVKNDKSLPFNPAKVKEAAAKSKQNKPTGTNPVGKKPTGVKKSRSTKPPKRSEKGDAPSLGKMLGEARKWIVTPTSYMLRNPETGCFGLSVRKPDAERSEITIAHTEDCGCLDARLMHIARHVDAAVKARLLTRRFRDSFVITIKIQLRLPHPIPKEARFPTWLGEKQVIRRPRAEMDAEVKIINVVDVHRQQKLIEKWKSLKAYKERPIWKDW